MEKSIFFWQSHLNRFDRFVHTGVTGMYSCANFNRQDYATYHHRVSS
jgi:hypothetical protein